MIDLRSDTVTRPTAEMRRAMATAEVGDDVYGEDPTVRALEERAAGIVGLEAALFVPSGSMGNQIAINLATSPGDEVLAEEGSHVVLYELGAMAAISGAQVKTLVGVGGLPSQEDVRPILSAPPEYDISRVRLFVLENSHAHAGGRVLPLAAVSELQTMAQGREVALHLDGARVFNAAHALGRDVSDLVSGFDSVMFCLSKGLGAPVGSMLCGSASFIEEARVIRKRLGGGMRQVGILAAAGLWALDHHRERLVDDHRRAQRIAVCLSELPGMGLSGEVETNMVIAELDDPSLDRAFLQGLHDRGLLAGSMGPGRVRFVTHLDVDDSDLDAACDKIREAWKPL